MDGETGLLSDVIYWLLWAVVWVAPGIVTALIARDRGRPVWRWLVLGVIFSWLSLIAIILLPDKSGEPKLSVQEWEEEKARASSERDGSADTDTAESGGSGEPDESDGSGEPDEADD